MITVGTGRTGSLTGLRHRVRESGRRRAFSLVEILVVVALLSVIVLGLMAMFNQTQRAFRLGMSQTDILESGRMASDLIRRELERNIPAGVNQTNNSPNFYLQMVRSSLQPLPGAAAGAAVDRTNIMQDLFFLTHENRTWKGIGYFVRTNGGDDPTLPGGIGPIGTLYRFETNNTDAQFKANPVAMFAGFDNVLRQIVSNNISRIADGVLGFRVQPFDVYGFVLTNNPNWHTNVPWSLPPCVLSYNLVATNVVRPFPGEVIVQTYFFYSNAVPGGVEFSISMLEPQIYERYRSIPIDTAKQEFLDKQAAHVHVFRQSVHVRNVDPSAYRR